MSTRVPALCMETEVLPAMAWPHGYRVTQLPGPLWFSLEGAEYLPWSEGIFYFSKVPYHPNTME